MGSVDIFMWMCIITQPFSFYCQGPLRLLGWLAEPWEEPLGFLSLFPLTVLSLLGQVRVVDQVASLELMTIYIGCGWVMCMCAHVWVRLPVCASAEPETDVRSSSITLHFIPETEWLTEPGAWVSAGLSVQPAPGTTCPMAILWRMCPG